MVYSATVTSPLGSILLQAGEAGISGLYFTDQPDNPLQAQPASDPAAGVHGGRMLRGCRIVPARAGTSPGGSLLPAQTPDLRMLQDDTPAGAAGLLRQAGRQLDEYWQGQRKVFDLGLEPAGTGFQKRIWQALLQVPYGQTLSYGELAILAGYSTAHSRAAGAAVGSNPISIIIPCHRILAGNGTLNGYGGGLQRKLRLLEIEGWQLCPA